MGLFGETADRLGRLGGRWWPLLALAAAAALAFALLLDDLLVRPPPAAGRAVAIPYAVVNPAGARIGALAVDWPRRLRENEDGLVSVRYAAAPEWAAAFRAQAADRRAPLRRSGRSPE